MEIMGGYVPDEEKYERKKPNSWKQNKKYKLRKIRNVISISAGSVAIVASLVGGAKLIKTFSVDAYEKDVATVSFYDEQRVLAGTLPDAKYPEFYGDFEDSKELVVKLPEYIDVSKKLHKLGLDDEPEITYFENAVVFVGPERVKEKIEEYKVLKHKVCIDNGNKVIGDDVIKLNYLSYELRELEKMYNKKIFDGYTALEEYGLASTKSYLADLYGGDPSKYEIKFNDYQHNGGIEISGPGIKYGDKIDSDIYDYLYAVREVYKAENATFNPDPEAYNKDRNKLIDDTIDKYITEGADVIRDIENQNKKK